MLTVRPRLWHIHGAFKMAESRTRSLEPVGGCRKRHDGAAVPRHNVWWWWWWWGGRDDWTPHSIPAFFSTPRQSASWELPLPLPSSTAQSKQSYLSPGSLRWLVFKSHPSSCYPLPPQHPGVHVLTFYWLHADCRRRHLSKIRIVHWRPLNWTFIISIDSSPYNPCIDWLSDWMIDWFSKHREN